MLSRPDGFILNGKVGVDFICTSFFPYPKLQVRLRLIRARPNFYMNSDNSNVSLGIFYCSLYPDCIALSNVYQKKTEWTC